MSFINKLLPERSFQRRIPTEEIREALRHISQCNAEPHGGKSFLKLEPPDLLYLTDIDIMATSIPKSDPSYVEFYGRKQAVFGTTILALLKELQQPTTLASKQTGERVKIFHHHPQEDSIQFAFRLKQPIQERIIEKIIEKAKELNRESSLDSQFVDSVSRQYRKYYLSDPRPSRAARSFPPFSDGDINKPNGRG